MATPICESAGGDAGVAVELPFTIKNRWRFKARVAQGTFGAVYAGTDLRTHERVCTHMITLP